MRCGHGHLIVAGGALLVAGLLATLLAGRLRVPSLVMFLGLGMLVGSDGLGWISFDDYRLARTIGVIALALILFEGGLTSGLLHVRSVLGAATGLAESLEFFNIAFFAVLLSTLVQGSTFEALAGSLRLTTSEPALPRPLVESGTIRRLRAEVLEYQIAPDDAIVGARVRDLGLPRDAVVNVIVRAERAIPPRGSTRLLAGDDLYVLINEESAGNHRPPSDLHHVVVER